MRPGLPPSRVTSAVRCVAAPHVNAHVRDHMHVCAFRETDTKRQRLQRRHWRAQYSAAASQFFVRNWRAHVPCSAPSWVQLSWCASCPGGAHVPKDERFTHEMALRHSTRPTPAGRAEVRYQSRRVLLELLCSAVIWANNHRFFLALCYEDIFRANLNRVPNYPPN